MKIAIVTITEQGFEIAQRIITAFEPEPFLYILEKIAVGSRFSEIFSSLQIRLFTEPLSQLVARIFRQFDGLVFIMAAGIVVRTIAPNIRNKYVDPAVVVIDDVGRFVISLLSGHEGGANLLANRIAAVLHTDAVITTGTEAQKDHIIGVGCKKGVASEMVKEALLDAMRRANITLEHVRLIATVDIKSQEKGLVRATEELGIPLRVVSLLEIATCAKEYCKSDFVKEKIGVWAVCEPVALIAGRKTKLILTKQKYRGVTVAIAKENFMW
ncbi:MAG: cobalamin biosynthesis protein [Candidatus Brocadiaceae bacterium]|nr:cobalamin biosynthesis protein [Candidatus Brocadiaceae bacterium]